jgi:hypothetical protein
VTLLQRLRNLVNGMLRMALHDTPRLLHVLRPRLSHQDGSFVVFVKINFSWVCSALLASVTHSPPLKSTMLAHVHCISVCTSTLGSHHLTAIDG